MRNPLLLSEKQKNSTCFRLILLYPYIGHVRNVAKGMPPAAVRTPSAAAASIACSILGAGTRMTRSIICGPTFADDHFRDLLVCVW
jgi:hypothetical protein